MPGGKKGAQNGWWTPWGGWSQPSGSENGIPAEGTPSHPGGAITATTAMADRNTLQQHAQVQQDCLSCRLIGAAAFGGLGSVVYFTGHTQLQQSAREYMKGGGTKAGFLLRQRSVTGLAVGLVGLGVYRLVM